MKKNIKKISDDNEIISALLGKEETLEIESEKNEFSKVQKNEKEKKISKNFEELLATYGTDIKKTEKEEKTLTLFEKINSYPPVQKTKDLHGSFSTDVEKIILSFISECRTHGLKTVRIITGKGLHSQAAPVIPDTAWDALVKLKRENKITFMKWEKKNNPLSGSIIVFI